MWKSLQRKKKKIITKKQVAKAVGIKLLEEFLVRLVETYGKEHDAQNDTKKFIVLQIVIWTIHNIGGYQSLKMLGLSKKKIKFIRYVMSGVEMTTSVSTQLFDFESEFYKKLTEFSSK